MFGLKVISLLILTVGFAKLSVAIVNRLLSTPRPKRLVFVLEMIQMSMIPIYFAGLYTAFFGQHTPRLDEVPHGELSYLVAVSLIALGAIGFVILVWSAIEFQLYRPPKCEVAAESKIIDFREEDLEEDWKQFLVGSKGMRPIALLPGNEQFSVEVSTKTYKLPRLPAEWDGLSIVHFADMHFYHAVTSQYFELVCEQAMALKPDMYVFTGDLLDDIEYLGWFSDTLGRLKAPLGQFSILGNHDWYIEAETIRNEFQRHGWIDLAGRSIVVESLTSKSSIIMAGDETPWMGAHPPTDPADSDKFRILLSHTPDNIMWARQQKFDLVLAGHTHGGQIRLPVIGPLYAPSYHGCRYASGVFWLDPTLMYVSRGLSGREPIRYLCRPELTKIVLRRGEPDNKTRS